MEHNIDDDLETVSPNTCATTARSIAFALTAILFMANIFAILFVLIFPKLVAFTSLMIYILAIPLGYILIRKLPTTTWQTTGLGDGGFIKALCICVFLSILGSVIGNYVVLLLEMLVGQSIPSPVASVFSEQYLWFSIVLVLIIAPVVEELLFRKVIIDRLAHFGKWNCILFSGLTFGLFHGNFSQFFYAFFVGITLAYVYYQTRKIWIPIVLHAIINGIGVMSSFVASGMDLEPLVSIYSLLLFVSILLGLIFFIVAIVKLIRRKDFDRIRGASFGNLGMIAFYVITAVLFVLNTL